MDRIYKYLVEQIRRLMRMSAYGFNSDKSKVGMPEIVYQHTYTYSDNATWGDALTAVANAIQNELVNRDYSKTYELTVEYSGSSVTVIPEKRIFREVVGTAAYSPVYHRYYTLIGLQRTYYNGTSVYFERINLRNTYTNGIQGNCDYASIDIVTGDRTRVDTTADALIASSGIATITLYAYDY